MVNGLKLIFFFVSYDSFIILALLVEKTNFSPLNYLYIFVENQFQLCELISKI